MRRKSKVPIVLMALLLILAAAAEIATSRMLAKLEEASAPARRTASLTRATF